MRILIAFYSLNNLGGIINSHECLVAGFQALGHSVENRLLVWTREVNSHARRDRRLQPETGASGVPFDQQLGWQWPASMKVPYQGAANLKRWKKFASRFDLIIWQIPVPTMARENERNVDWTSLYDVHVPQIVVVHDGNMWDCYPWIYAIKDKLTGAIGVHPCAYHSLAWLPVPRAMALSPQVNIAGRVKAADAHSERSGWCSFQTFKGWKRVDELVRAVPHMANTERKILGGGGLHYHYMTSKDKLKPEYIADRIRDPDLPHAHVGERIWNLALKGGMEYAGYVHNDDRDHHLRAARFLIDPSWSKKCANIGDHFNRTTVEAIISGCVPIARNLGVATNEAGNGEFFKAGDNYLMIPSDAKPKEFADSVDAFVAMNESDRRAILEEGRRLLPLFDYRRTAQTFIDLANGKPAGIYAKKDDRGRYYAPLARDAAEAIATFFSL
jgi:hypothetical protein